MIDPQVTSTGVPRYPVGVTCESGDCDHQPKSDPRFLPADNHKIKTTLSCARTPQALRPIRKLRHTVCPVTCVAQFTNR